MRHVLLVAMLCCLLYPPSGLAQATEEQSSQSHVLSSPGGRYVFGQVSTFRRDQFLLDTQTGRMWEVVVDKAGQDQLQPMPFDQVFGGQAFIPDPMREVETQRALMLKERAADENKSLPPGFVLEKPQKSHQKSYP